MPAPLPVSSFVSICIPVVHAAHVVLEDASDTGLGFEMSCSGGVSETFVAYMESDRCSAMVESS